jgi:hypothetical protein
MHRASQFPPELGLGSLPYSVKVHFLDHAEYVL